MQPPLSIPVRSARSRNAVREYAYDAVTYKGRKALKCTGSMFLADINSPPLAGSGGAVNTRLLAIEYLHAQILPSKPAKIAHTFAKYRFQKFTFRYCPEIASADRGELYMTWIPDPNTDPTDLNDRQLKVYLDSIPNTFKGSVYQLEQATCTFIPEDDKLYLIYKDSDTLENIYQGKFLLACSGTANLFIGDIEMDFEVLFFEDELSVQDCLSMALQKPQETITFPAGSTAGDNVLATLPNTQKHTNGVYSITNRGSWPETGAPANTIAGKLWNFGSEVLAAVTGVDPSAGTGGSATFFKDMASMVAGQALKWSTGNVGALPWIARLVPLLFDSKGSDLLTIEDGLVVETRTKTSRMPKWATTKGYQLAIEEHNRYMQSLRRPCATVESIASSLKEQNLETPNNAVRVRASGSLYLEEDKGSEGGVTSRASGSSDKTILTTRPDENTRQGLTPLSIPGLYTRDVPPYGRWSRND